MSSAPSEDFLFAVGEAGGEVSLQRLYDRLAARFGLDPARVRLSRRKLTGGEIVYGPPHTITISAHLSKAEREETLRHEAAHAWAFRRKGPRVGHGPLFQRLARQIGVRKGPAPETKALAEFRRVRQIEYRCQGCGETFRRIRPFRGPRDCVACWRAGRPSRLRKVRSP
ncbi:MAG TPA: SprT-like domain-containing protein [Thermoanaerobaculia bacterium]|nr:SprT-like domain-containing protein [Thermoanaerobaculia bacterium]